LRLLTPVGSAGSVTRGMLALATVKVAEAGETVERRPFASTLQYVTR
jgi:hypothetical protein